VVVKNHSLNCDDVVMKISHFFFFWILIPSRQGF
jgi:hypothetical protein